MLKKLKNEEKKKNQKQKKQIKLTIFTPTYNRAYILGKLYNSLKNQTDKNFIWLIVDDGSTDQTEKIVKKWQNENVIKIEYYKKENGGKHTTIDFSNKVCKTEYIGCVDSDDYLAENAVSVVNSDINDVKEDDVGLVYIKNLGKDYSAADFLDGKSIYFYDFDKVLHFLPETFLIFKTNFIKNYHFPVFDGERFVTEAVLYDQFMFEKTLLFKKAKIYLAEYLPDGYTNQGLDLFFKNPQGYMYFLKQRAAHVRGLKKKAIFASYYYAWKKALGIKDESLKQIKIKFPLNIVGKIFANKFYNNYLTKFEEFKTKNGTK